ncbi:winged helix-turn-helix transcriptional regulator [Nocardia sp. NPDC006044]|uniref:winged helix-turn-helix transcriptional regulator n=1 Tax=Nocardia sp. NPDC006044 TaxID=3364306 RepID=UPI0036944A51
MSGTNTPLPPFDPICPMSTFPIQIGGKWTAMIVLCLESGPQRFGTLRRHLQPISAKVLTETLSTMQRDGLIRRHLVEDVDGCGVEYALTSLGRTILGLIEHVRQWTREHLNELLRLREIFDSTNQINSAS